MRVVLMLIETFAVGSGPRWWRKAAQTRVQSGAPTSRPRRLVHGADVDGVHDAAQRLSVAVQCSAAQKVAETLGLSVPADPRAALYG